MKIHVYFDEILV